jgi:hypothetical protein
MLKGCADLNDPYYDSEANLREKMKVMRQSLTPKLADIPVPAYVENYLTPQGPAKFATILSGETKQLLAMDRYERRALSRRKFAIRAFDAAGRKPMS